MSAATPLTLQPLREVRLYGPLGRQFGRVHRLAVETPAEAVRALMTLLPGFRQAIRMDGLYRVLVGRGERRHAIGEAGLTCGLGSADCVRIVPLVEGAKRQGVAQIVTGLVLMAAAVVSYAVGFVYTQPWAVALGSGLESASWAMLFGGVVSLLSPQRKSSTGDKESTASYVMDGPVNVTQEGGPVPLIIGRVICGSVVVSSGLHADDVAIRGQPGVPPPPNIPYEQGRYPGLPPGQEPDRYQPGQDAFGHPAELLQ